jgi:oligopeptide transport system permease protein
MTTPHSLPALSPDDFLPLQQRPDAHGITRPSRSYWQDAWARLRRNRRALLSLWIIVALLAFALVGPLVWTVDPARQDIDQISQAPGADRSATLVAPYAAWNGLATAGFEGGSGLRLAAAANSQVVRLLWDAVPGAQGYRLYRNIFPVDQDMAFGLPIAEFPDSGAGFYEDRLDLRPDTYYYSLVALGEGRALSARFEVLEVEVTRVITLDEVRTRGLVAQDLALAEGDEVLLALHPLGTDYLGRDMLARLMAGARVSLFIGIVAPLLYVLLGVLYGSTAGFLGGRVDQWMMRFADFVVALPFLLFMILFQVVFGIGPGESGILPDAAGDGAARLARHGAAGARADPADPRGRLHQASRLLGRPTGTSCCAT